MRFSGLAAPEWLMFAAVVAALSIGYLWVLRLRRKHTLRFTNLELSRPSHRPGPVGRGTYHQLCYWRDCCC